MFVCVHSHMPWTTSAIKIFHTVCALLERYYGNLCESLWSALNALFLQLWTEFDKLFAIE